MTRKLTMKYLSVIAGVSHLLLVALQQAGAATLTLGFADAATAEDRGPEDGVFDAFVPLNLGSVDNNGYTSFRTALEFNLSSVPFGSTVHAATLTLRPGFIEGTRSLALHGYAGDGTVQLMDFSVDGLVAHAILTSTTSDALVLDATGFITGLISRGEGFAGFNLREAPANLLNFGVIGIDMTGSTAPRLFIEYVPVPEPSGVCLLGIGLMSLILLNKNSRQRPSNCAPAPSAMPLAPGAVPRPAPGHAAVICLYDASLSRGR